MNNLIKKKKKKNALFDDARLLDYKNALIIS